MSGARDELVGQYLRDIRHRPLLTADEEHELGALVGAGRAAEKRLAEGGTIDRRTRSALARQAAAGRRAAREFVEANLRLVVSIAVHHRWSRLSLLDLVQAGNIALMQAVDTFDPERGLRFSTYATWRIRMAIGREILTSGHPIRLPVHVAQHLAALHRVSSELELVLAREPTAVELSEALGWSAAEVAELRALPADPASLDAGRDPDAGPGLSETLADPSAADPAEIVPDGELAAEVDRMLEELDELERTVLVLRYGLHGEAPTGWDDLARRLSVPRGEVRRIARQGVDHLRRAGAPRRLSGAGR